MSNQLVLLCGVPGSGKTWVIDQLGDAFAHVQHDAVATRQTNASHTVPALVREAASYLDQPKPLIMDCPFNERAIREALLVRGFKVLPVFIIEDASVVASRYLSAKGRPAPQATLTRATTIMNKADEWAAKRGTAAEVLTWLQGYAASLAMG